MKTVGVLGASSFVGQALLPMLHHQGFHVIALSRSEWQNCKLPPSADLEYLTVSQYRQKPMRCVDVWIFLVPIWTATEWFDEVQYSQAKRVIAISSTSENTKSSSSDDNDIAVANRLVDGREMLEAWCQIHHVECTVFKTTMLYGHGKDKNIAVIAKYLSHVSVFPVVGKANGLRMPLHVDDLSRAIVDVIDLRLPSYIYTLSGGNTLTYKEMVETIANEMRGKVVFLPVPLWLVRIFLRVFKLHPQFKHISLSMFERMSHDMVFESGDAIKDFGFKARKFTLLKNDLPE